MSTHLYRCPCCGRGTLFTLQEWTMQLTETEIAIMKAIAKGNVGGDLLHQRIILVHGKDFISEDALSDRLGLLVRHGMVTVQPNPEVPLLADFLMRTLFTVTQEGRNRMRQTLEEASKIVTLGQPGPQPVPDPAPQSEEPQ